MASKPMNKLKSIKIPKITPAGRLFEFRKIYDILSNFIATGKGAVLYISGVPGSGKTYTVATVLRKILRDLAFRPAIVDSKNQSYLSRISKFSVSFVNCSELKQKNKIYFTILKKFTGLDYYSSTSCINDINLLNLQRKRGDVQGLRYHLLDCNCIHLIVVDEVDFIITKDEQHLYNLLELPFLESVKVFIIFLSNTLGTRSTKVESRIGHNRMEFKPYSASQLMEIIDGKNIDVEHNASSSRNSSKFVLSKKASNFISKKVASGTGDIRKMKLMLEKTEVKNIQEINDNFRKMNYPIINYFIKYLSVMQKKVFCSLILINNDFDYEKEIPIVDLFLNYKTFCRIYDSETENCLDFYQYKEIIEEFVEMGICKSNKLFTKVIPAFSVEEIKEIICKDELLSKYIDVSKINKEN